MNRKSAPVLQFKLFFRKWRTS